MSTWSKDELRKIAETDDLHISPLREDGTTYGTPTWIWSVVVEDALYVRAYNGQNSRWYQAAVRQKAGSDHCGRHDEGSHLRDGRRAYQRPNRQSLLGKVPWQSLSQPDDQRRRLLRDSQGHPARGRRVIEMASFRHGQLHT